MTTLRWRDLYRILIRIVVLGRRERYMRPMQRQLGYTVYSSLTDREAARRLEDLVRRHPRAAEITKSRARREMTQNPGYVTDRSWRLLNAAMTRTAPAPVPPERADVYEQESTLGRRPLRDAFASLAAAEPELAKLATLVLPLTGNVIADDRAAQTNRSIWQRANALVDLRLLHTDPVVRTVVARQVVARDAGSSIVRHFWGRSWIR